MDVVAFEIEPMELEPGDKRVQIFLALRDDSATSWILKEKDVRAIAMTIVEGLQTGSIPRVNGSRLVGGRERANEFLACRNELQAAQRFPRGLIVEEISVAVEHRDVVVEAVSIDGVEENIWLDGFAAEAFLISANEEFG